MKELIISLRQANNKDLVDIKRIFVDTVINICKSDYNSRQIDAWVSSVNNNQRWINKINTQYFLVAEIDNKIVGYASLEDKFYIDLFYVHKDYQRQGIGSILYSEIEKEAIFNNSNELFSDVSKTALLFFKNKGFSIVKQQVVLIDDIEIINYKMNKML